MLKTIPVSHRPSWQEILREAVSDPAELLQALDLSPESVGLSRQALADFPLRVPRPFLERMRPGDPDDPLLRQVLPAARETEEAASFSRDPLAENRFNPRPGLLQKYHGRALVLATGTCAVHCRYCFRRHFPYADNIPGRKQWHLAFEHLARDTTIEEVILSGGDPLAAPDRYLAWMAEALARIPHLQRLRIHTRLPVMIPQRIDEALCDWLTASRLRTIVVIHSNHAREFDEAVDAACRRLSEAGAMLLNQSVLLRGINDSAEALIDLGKRAFTAGVLPYYLHLLDRTAGTAHFEVPEREARSLLHAVRAGLPGYLVPTLVREIPGKEAKTPVG